MITSLPDGWVLEPAPDDRWMSTEPAAEDSEILIRHEKTGRVITLGELRDSDGEKAWDPAKHPRHPAGAPGSQGGEFSGNGGGAAGAQVGSEEWAAERKQQAIDAAKRLREEAAEDFAISTLATHPLLKGKFENASEMLAAALSTGQSIDELWPDDPEWADAEWSGMYGRIKEATETLGIMAEEEIQPDEVEWLAEIAAKELAAEYIEQRIGAEWAPREIDQLTQYDKTANDLVRHHLVKQRESRLVDSGLMDERALNQANETLKKHMEDSMLVVHRREASAEKILIGGRFKTQFETNSSSGALNHEYRNEAEEAMFINASKDPMHRPVYGTAYSNKLIDEFRDYSELAARHYGPIMFQLKDSVRDRATYTGDDSLSVEEGTPNLVPSPVRTPSAGSVLPPFMLEARNIREYGQKYMYKALKASPLNGGSYAEIQYHGGVSVRDVVAVFDYRNSHTPPNPRVMGAARLNGIDYYKFFDDRWSKVN